ncbi:MAG: tRNA (adenosine(37)-N6)-threonylcarbamoyltransferase complex ATPase subunit type 1 TsaE [Roseovarius sp.]|uniref:tRNA (adenosine(37)-N6)-threonylcarbamoyltransferase complex ATPase subunit type 1 TsaE n=1 Tax=Roseovarius sp. TaxID=1486281 RepID=UPI001B5225A6|nr:tRNA (adenosine(37)-N6)-threonylcarbamoyltransferase complex ATPase subunit type 1 TsaE [Roseovarius sp.]MBQ0752092.1 tRNA (adenosine(37)-N6)-threonylcarbamoyltransferase complex ATPase subunit type 1 TsaE [Roseovarius sp.]MBQ0811925.1 tRNA (adenosine(37)-N6)-threonylcarbamoyltransferase complex ATPase subunit type 1 TsaE [Roseovarius sp.]
MSDHSAQIPLASPDATCALARRLAPRLRPGDALLLSGGVGAGKTHFARCLIQSLLIIPEDVPSPTYTLVQTYQGPGAEIWHADLYRLSDAMELVELGLTEAFTDAICLIEWPDRLGDMTPPDALGLEFTPVPEPGAEERRLLRITWQDDRWAQRLEGLLDD